jgi:hypothetical protein
LELGPVIGLVDLALEDSVDAGVADLDVVAPRVEHLAADAVVPTRGRDARRDLLGVSKYRQPMPDLALLLSIVQRTSPHERPQM